MINEPVRHPHREEILKWKKVLKLTDEQVNQLFEYTRFLSNDEFRDYIERALRTPKGNPGKHFFKDEMVTVVTSTIYYLQFYKVEHFLNDIIKIGNTNRSRYSKMLAAIFAMDSRYNFIHPEKQNVPRSSEEHLLERLKKRIKLWTVA